MALDESTRLREEDPWTGGWTVITDNWVVGHRSRFEVDLNRPPEKAVYRRADDAWGLATWRPEVTENVFAESLELHATFYRRLKSMIGSLLARHSRASGWGRTAEEPQSTPS